MHFYYCTTFRISLDLELFEVEQNLVLWLDVYEPVALLAAGRAAVGVLLREVGAGDHAGRLLRQVAAAFCFKF